MTKILVYRLLILKNLAHPPEITLISPGFAYQKKVTFQTSFKRVSNKVEVEMRLNENKTITYTTGM
jgi:hypothetical protein